MKSLFKKFSTAVVVLAAVALLSVPLLGGARLAADCGRIEKNSIILRPKPINTAIISSPTWLFLQQMPRAFAMRQRASRGRILPPCAAFKTILPNTKNAVPHLKNLIASNVCLRMQSAFMPPFGGSVTDSLMTAMDGIESADSRISRTYGAKYSECMKSRSDLLSGGLSSAIAKIYGIGGNNTDK